MAKTSVELREERAGIIKQARDKHTEAQARSGGATAEDKQAFDVLMAKATDLKEQYESLERLEAAEADLETPDERASEPIGEQRDGGKAKGSTRGSHRTAAEFRSSPEYRAVYSDYLATGQIPYAKIPHEFRDTILGTDSKGGFLVTPVQLVNEIVKAVDDAVFIRSKARIWRMPEAKALGVPRITSRMADADWTAEVGPVTEDTTMSFDRRDLKPYLMTKLAKVSIEALERSSNVESIVQEELAYKNAITEEKAYMTGNGVGRPLGAFTASANGVPVARDVTAGNTATEIRGDNLLAMKYSLKAQYRADPTTAWIFSRPAVEAIMKLKDGENRYLWQPSLQAGQPDRLLNIPVAESEYAPATFTTGLYVGVLGCWRYYWIAEVSDLRIQRLIEKYAETNEVGYISRRWVDGAPILAEAFSRSKLA